MGQIITDPSKELAPIKARATKMQSVVNALIIRDTNGLEQATKIRSGIKAVAKEIDEKKKEITAPLNLALKNVRALFAPLEVACEEAFRSVDVKVLVYNREIEKTRAEEEAKLAVRVEKGTLKVETAAKKLEVVPEAQRRVVTEKGKITIIKIKKFKVVDLAKLPIEYLLPNEPEIRRAMHVGTELPGVEYWQEDSVSGR